MNSRYVLITCYLTHRIHGGATWLVYGHIDIAANESLGEYSTQAEAVAEAFQHGVPVMLGMRYEEVLRKLSSD